MKDGARFLKNGARAAGAFALSLCLVPVPVRGQEAADTSECLPLPAVPASLRTPAERAGYIVRHFWDSMDFADVRRTRDSGFMERNFTNYLSLFPVADASVLVPAVDSLVARVRADGESLSVLCGLAGKYLYEQDSPAYDEEYYLLFADAFMKTPLPGRERARLLAQREAALKNRVGAPAADFSYETPTGERARMSETGRGKPLLLLFYDPDCGHCWEVMEQLRSMEPLCRTDGRGELEVLAVYAGYDDRQAWRKTLDRLPAGWTAGYDDGTIYTEDLYVPRRMPAIYLLDRERRVVAKDPPPDRLPGLIGGRRCEAGRRQIPGRQLARD